MNEFGNRVRWINNIEPILHYFVGDNERDFIKKLKGEIEVNSNVIFKENTTKLSIEMIEILCKISGLPKLKLQNDFLARSIIDEDLNFLENDYKALKALYPQAFDNNGLNRIRKHSDKKPLAHIRKDKYKALQTLWEILNQKVILEYKIKMRAIF